MALTELSEDPTPVTQEQDYYKMSRCSESSEIRSFKVDVYTFYYEVLNCCPYFRFYSI